MKLTCILGITPLLLLAAPGAAAADPADLPAFHEVYGLIRSNLTGVTTTELDAAAVRGLAQQFPGRVVLLTNVSANVAATTNAATGGPTTRVFDESFAYVRIPQVEAGLASALAEALAKLGTARPLGGLVIDLRFAGGDDYAEAGRVADRFVAEAGPLLSWGTGTVVATTKTNAFEAPVAVLVNRETGGAAEALAAVLRQTQAGLVIGSRTAGLAAEFREFNLSSGQRVRVAVAPVKVGDGQVLTPEGVQPDIVVTVSPADERAFLADPYRAAPSPKTLLGGPATRGETNPAASSTNRTPRPNEADLVRLRREGLSLDEPVITTAPKVVLRPLVTDPALARALDLLKGLSVVRPVRRH